MGKKTHYDKNVFEHFWREKINFNMDCTIVKKPPSQTLLEYSILSLAVSPELSGITIVCTALSTGGRVEPLTKFSKRGARQDLRF